MTREEAIRIIETVFQDEYVYKYYDSITHQALDMAIEALSAETHAKRTETHECVSETHGDLISRQDAIRAVFNTSIPFSATGRTARQMKGLKRDAVGMIKSLPSAEAEWIPCSEKLPEKEELVLVTVWNDVVIAWRNRYGGWESVEDMYEKGDVIAWMPSPEPYREESEVGE